eukprot:gene3234-5944_t
MLTYDLISSRYIYPSVHLFKILLYFVTNISIELPYPSTKLLSVPLPIEELTSATSTYRPAPTDQHLQTSTYRPAPTDQHLQTSPTDQHLQTSTYRPAPTDQHLQTSTCHESTTTEGCPANTTTHISRVIKTWIMMCIPKLQQRIDSCSERMETLQTDIADIKQVLTAIVTPTSLPS